MFQSEKVGFGPILRREGASPAISDPLSYADRIIREAQAEFHLGVDVPLRQETTISLDWLSTTPPDGLSEFGADRLGKSKQLVVPSKGRQSVWGDSIPEPLRMDGRNIQAIALHQLMPHFGLGGGKWVCQLASGFPTTGVVSQVVVFPNSDNAKPPISHQMMWK